MKKFKEDCLEFLKTGRKQGMFNAGPTVNLNAVLGCAINFAHDRLDDVYSFECVYEACNEVTEEFGEWVLEGN